MAQVKDQKKTPEKELNKIEARKLLNAEFKTLVIKMLKELSEDINSIKKIQSEIKYILIEIKNNLQRNNSRVDEAEKLTICNKRQKKQPIRTRRRKQNPKKTPKTPNRGDCKQPVRQL